MKLDLNKPWIMKLVQQNSTANGCSFIRGVILRTIGTALLWVGGVTVLTLLAMALISGLYMWIDNPMFFSNEFNRMEYFGTGWVAQTWAVLTFCGGIVWVLGTFFAVVGGLIWGLVKGAGKYSPALGSAATTVWNAVSLPPIFKEAVSAWYHKFCPHIEFILPPGFSQYVVGARVAKGQWTSSEEFNLSEPNASLDWSCEGTIAEVQIKGDCMRVYVLWDSSQAEIDEMTTHWVEKAYTPEQIKEEIAGWTEYYVDCKWLYFKEDNGNFKAVEEISSPQ